MPSTLKPLSKLDLHRDDSSTAQRSTEKIQFKYQRVSLYKVSISYKVQLNPNRYSDHYIFRAFMQAQKKCWNSNNQKLLTLRMKFLCPFVFDKQTDDSNPIFQVVKKKRVPFQTKKYFWNSFQRNLPKKAFCKKEGLPLHFQFIYSIIWYLHIELARQEVMTFQYSIVCLHQKMFPTELQFFHRNVFFPLTLHI